MYKLYIDYREKEIQKELEENNQEYKSENLEMGDIVIKDDSNSETVILIERKTVSDYISSIMDNRSKEQRIRIKENRKKIRVFYVIEGFSFISSKDQIYKRINRDRLLSSMIHLQLRDHFEVYHTRNVKETVEWIMRLIKKLEIYPIKSNENNETEYTNALSIQHKKMTNKENCIYKIQLMAIPRLSNEFAEKIKEKYSSIFKLVEEYNKLETEKEKKEMLMEIKNKNGRRLGKVLSERIYLSLN